MAITKKNPAPPASQEGRPSAVETSLQRMPTNAEAAVLQGAALQKVEGGKLSSVALMRPRDEAAILRASLSELEMVPEDASKAWYALPMKSHKDGCDKRRSCSCPGKDIEGLSIRSAYSLARRWGNSENDVEIESETDDGWIIAGVFLDAESNVRFRRPFRISKFAKRKGQIVRLSDRDLDAAFQSGISKAARNAIFAGLPEYLKAAYWRKAREVDVAHFRKTSGGGGKLGEKIAAQFLAFGVEREKLTGYLGHGLEALSDEEVADLRGIYLALKEGERDAAAIFGAPQEKEAHSITPEMMQSEASAESREMEEEPKAKAPAAKKAAPSEDEGLFDL